MITKDKNIWYLIRTKPRQEFIAALNLESQGFEVYLPQYTLKGKVSALFPGYIFIHMNERLNYSKVSYTRGVQNFVKFGGWFASVPHGVIQLMKEKELATAVQSSELLKIHKGDSVEVLDGPLKGFNAIFEGYSDEGRVKVLFDMLNNQQTVELEEKWVSLLQKAN